ncbi:hypothetical protein TREMEDRAFT_69868 [Tremella mesenterica DSM 1558]|uniref:uncharacterized protein n=1 Tax=Tremella mesenterica (strain ATCC 24925 / CBS 8224 / DSM 1558 / NBRC 9311 / NRRL Y-6157 / RJB 2259-6 / UBC 559-6) TaxID=578456 RepID=UPI0003F48C37|nr:uncharacterized protein TREMEDRAFT_69868 [Tremella mesenterica DSM 1558]EIW66866.1 hypothetical protein TREMEDRAFT_69868 [Tremella mesenterica DSM 1558]
MPRRRKDYLSDGSDSDASQSGQSEGGFNSQEDEDSRAERELFEYNGNKRRKKGGGKEAAWEGIFGEEEEDYRAGGRGLGSKRGVRGGKASSSRTDWTKAPAFVPKAANTEVSKSEEVRDVKMASEDEEESGSENDTDDEPTRPPSPRVREEEPEEDDQPRRGMGMGLGFKPASSVDDEVPLQDEDGGANPKIGGRAGIGSSNRGRGGIGSSSRAGLGATEMPTTASAGSVRGGLGSSNAPSNMMDSPTPTPSVPSAFGRPTVLPTSEAGPSRPQSSFRARPAAPTTAPPPTANLTAAEKAHFRSIESSFGARMLAKAGWVAGKGLGMMEDGRAVPVAAGKIIRGQGISSGIRTEDSKRDARRRGEKVSDDEEEKPRRRGKAGRAGGNDGPNREQEQGWKNQRKVKVKVEHKTYEQLLAEAGQSAAAGVGQIIDARGGEMKEVSSMSALSLSSWTPTSDSTQLPELRHNLRLILDVGKDDVTAAAREGKMINERRAWSLKEEERARRRVEEADKESRRLERISTLIESITTKAAAQAAHADPSLARLTEDFGILLNDFKDEYVALGLDDVVVGAIAQILKRSLNTWQPFEVSSDVLLSSLKPWRHAFNLPRSDNDDAQALVPSDNSSNGVNGHNIINGERDMSAWETLLWTAWLPKVRSAINNEWDPSKPQAAVHLLESWDPILPPFIRDNIIDQLVLPKVKAAADHWDPRRAKLGKGVKSLAGVVFPWLPLLGARADEMLEGATRRLRSAMRSWVVKDGVPDELLRWRKDVFSSSEWDKLMLQTVVPKLGATLREDFTINPRSQDMVPLVDWVMPWHNLLRPSVFSHLIEVEFFPKWLDILYIWLIQPTYKPDEVANWYDWWKRQFPQEVLDMRGIAHGFDTGIQLMMSAVDLGPEAPSKLRKPNYAPLPPSKSSKSSSKSTTSVSRPRPMESTMGDITFRNLAEEAAAQHDLIFLPLGKSHLQTGKPLFKVAKDATGRGGLTIYVGESAVFAQGEDGTYKAVSLEDMVKRALA